MLDPTHPIAELLARDDRYPFDAYVFVFEALRHAQEKMGMGTEHLGKDFPSEFDSEMENALDEDDGQPGEERIRDQHRTRLARDQRCPEEHWILDRGSLARRQ